MKKLFSVCIAVIMVASLCVTGFAAGNSISCTASKTDLKVGETVSFSVSLTNTDAFKAFGLSFEYNTNVFEFVNGKWFIQGTLRDVDKAKNKAAVIYKDATVQNGEIFTFEFKVKSGVEVGTYDISVVPTMKNGTNTINITGDTVKINVVEDAVSTPSDTSSTPSGTSSTPSDTSSTPSDTSSTPSGHTHKFGDFITDLEPTCTEPGVKSRHCSACNQRSEITNISPVGHDWNDWIVEYEPSEVNVGLKSRTCKACNEKQIAEIAKLSADGHEHTFGEWELTKAPTCAEKGQQIRACTVCNEQEKMEIVSLGHSYGDWSIKVVPTLEKEGLLECVCSVCHATKTQSIDKLKQDNASDSTDILMLVVIGLGAVILIGAGVTFVVGMKKRKRR